MSPHRRRAGDAAFGQHGAAANGPDSQLATRPPIIMHASTVAFGPRQGIAIIGPSGSGKTSLALALIGHGALLVADDRSCIWAQGDALFARAPRAIEGVSEQRGLGLLRQHYRRLVQLRLVIDLTAPETRRLPPAEVVDWQGITLPCLRAPAGGCASAAVFPAAVRHYIRGGVTRV